jgi:hypothetical protein
LVVAPVDNWTREPFPCTEAATKALALFEASTVVDGGGISEDNAVVTSTVSVSLTEPPPAKLNPVDREISVNPFTVPGTTRVDGSPIVHDPEVVMGEAPVTVI